MRISTFPTSSSSRVSVEVAAIFDESQSSGVRCNLVYLMDSKLEESVDNICKNPMVLVGFMKRGKIESYDSHYLKNKRIK